MRYNVQRSTITVRGMQKRITPNSLSLKIQRQVICTCVMRGLSGVMFGMAKQQKQHGHQTQGPENSATKTDCQFKTGQEVDSSHPPVHCVRLNS